MKHFHLLLPLTALCLSLLSACNSQTGQTGPSGIPVIFDTDCNNELDDQHALAYLLMNLETFDLKAITANATRSGGEISEHVKEAGRIIQLMNYEGPAPLLAGANGNFEEIAPLLDQEDYDGHEAVDFIITEALKKRDEKLILIPVGKLTNIALALKKEPAIAEHVRIVWLGSNYPDQGEYNLVNDIPSMNYILEQEVDFEIVNVHYGEPDGSAAVVVSQKEVNARMPGLGPKASEPITGRHGGQYSNFGDYSVNLFEHIDYHDQSKMRSLFDLVAVAVLKEAEWGQLRMLPCPAYSDTGWIEQPDNPRMVGLWEWFDRDAIVEDLFSSLSED